MLIWVGFINSQPSQSQSLDSVICQYSVSYCLSVGTVGYNLCRHQEQIISAKPAPYFGAFNFQIVLPDVSIVRQAPYNLWWRRLQSVPVASWVLVDALALLIHQISAVCLFHEDSSISLKFVLYFRGETCSLLLLIRVEHWNCIESG